jgi:hypothetical protein
MSRREKAADEPSELQLASAVATARPARSKAVFSTERLNSTPSRRPLSLSCDRRPATS